MRVEATTGDPMLGDVAKRAKILRLSGQGGWLSALCSAGSVAVVVYRFGAWTKRHPLLLPFRVLYFALFYATQVWTGISIQGFSRIGRRFVVLNHTCVFILAEQIGDDCTACQGVTLGNVRGARRPPVLGNNVYLEPGAKVLGEVTIGNNVVVRANSVVLNDIPDNSLAIGNPARAKPLRDEDRPEWMGKWEVT